MIRGDRFVVIDGRGLPALHPLGLGVAGVDEQAIRPGIEPLRVTESRQLLPDPNEGLLRGVLGEVSVAQDPVGHLLVVAVCRLGDLGEGRLVPLLRSHHEAWIHVPSAAGG